MTDYIQKRLQGVGGMIGPEILVQKLCQFFRIALLLVDFLQQFVPIICLKNFSLGNFFQLEMGCFNITAFKVDPANINQRRSV